jgi:endogenous inhibitor of DNA gyrase (YacG/DUF329 family)
VELGKWLDEQYRVPTSEPESDATEIRREDAGDDA